MSAPATYNPTTPFSVLKTSFPNLSTSPVNNVYVVSQSTFSLSAALASVKIPNPENNNQIVWALAWST